MLSAYLRSRVARRLFGRFLLAAVVPVVLLGGYAYVQVSGHLLQMTEQRLRDDSKAYGMALIGKLNTLQDELRLIARGGADRLASELDGSGSFNAISMPGNAVDLLPNAQRAHLARGQPVLSNDGFGHYSLWMPRAEDGSVVRGELKASTLWEDYSIGVPYCALGLGTETQYCTSELAGISLDLGQARTAHSGVFSTRVAGDEHLAAHWSASLEASLAHPGFAIVTLYPRTEMLAPLDRFRRIFPAVLALALVIAAWLSMGQIRRQMQPLLTLAGGAHRLAEGDFEARLEIESRDEFSEVAEAFNSMTVRLRHRFQLVEALADLDCAILAGAEVGQVARAALGHAPGVVACDYAGVLRAGGKLVAGSARLEHSPNAPRAIARIDDVAVSTADLDLLRATNGAFQADLQERSLSFLEPLAQAGLRHAWVFPALIDDRVSAVFILAFASAPPDLTEVIAVGRSFADRLAMADSSSAWEEKLYRNAHYDALTQLPNRALLHDRVEQAITRARHERSALAVLVIDLDRFREINDSLGHSVGDGLLCAVAERLARCVLARDTLARPGGDEFVILLTELQRGREGSIIDACLEQILMAMSRPFHVAGQSVSAQASVGIAMYPGHTDTAEGLLKGADAAMYEAKKEPTTSYRFFSEDIDSRAHERFRMVQRLRGALEREQFELYYQPKVEFGTGRIVGAEALLRWRDDEGRIVSPGAFVHVLEEIGLGPRVGDWVMRRACAQVAEWDRQGLPQIAVSVNVLPSHFQNSDIVASATEALTCNGLANERLEIEILEETAIDASGHTHDALLALRRIGIGVALDDFGTGYSSLVYLTRIPANILKLDRAFISSLSTDARQAAIVAGIISLAKQLGMQVVAEGVEKPDQLEMLASMGCDLVQGYIFSPPVPAAEFARLLERDAGKPPNEGRPLAARVHPTLGTAPRRRARRLA